MEKHLPSLLAIILLISVANSQTLTMPPQDLTKHEVRFVEVEPTVKIEVLDWGGSGSPVILVPGLGMTAHSFDAFASKLAETQHVYGITRRGVGKSSAPEPTQNNYAAARLGADVVTVMNQLKISKAFLLGHSFGGEELSEVAASHPEMVSGLIYLDAAYGYAFYDPQAGNLAIDSHIVREELARLVPGKGPLDQRETLRSLLAQLPLLKKGLEAQLKQMSDNPPPSDTSKLPPFPPQLSAMLDGQQKFSDPHLPVLAIFAFRKEIPPHGLLQDEHLRKAAGGEAVFTEEHAESLERIAPSARVVRLAHADHFVFNSNEPQVLTEVNRFINSFASSAPQSVPASERLETKQ